MISALKVCLVAAAVATATLCPLCQHGIRPAQAQQVSASQATDTATARLHISRMTCGTCPATARVALKKLPGVYSAVVTYDDSLGVVRYDPTKVSAKEIAEHLTKLTGYGAEIRSDTTPSLRRPRGR